MDGARQPGQTYIEKVVGDWERKCITLPEGQGDNPCQMYQLLKDDKGNAVAEVSLGRLPDGGQAVAGATVVVPLETLLTQQLTVAVDGGQGKRYPFRFCAHPGRDRRVQARRSRHRHHRARRGPRSEGQPDHVAERLHGFL